MSLRKLTGISAEVRLAGCIASFLFIASLFFGCAYEKPENEKLTVVTTLFPQYDFTRQIAGDLAQVSILLPPGAEPHSFEPTPRDVALINAADIFIYTSEHMEPWAARVISSVGDSGTKAVSCAGGDDDEHEHDDPHIWLDPLRAIEMVDHILDALIEADPENMSVYIENAGAYKERLAQLDRDIASMIERSAGREIIFCGHNTFGLFAERYGLTFITPYPSYSPDAEPTQRKVAELLDAINSRGAPCVYYEELIEPVLANAISSQTGAAALLLHGAHNVTMSELESGIGYIEIMEKNIDNLKLGLGYID